MTTPAWMGDGWTLFYFTIAILFMGHIFIPLLKNNTIRLYLAYFSLLLGGTALMTSFHSSSKESNMARTDFLQKQLIWIGEEINLGISFSQDYVCNFNAIRTLDSPDNFDEIELQRKASCSILSNMSSSNYNDKIRKKEKIYIPISEIRNIKDEYWRDAFRNIITLEKQYNDTIDGIEALKPRQNLLWSALEPYIIAASWSLGLALMIPTRKRKRRQTT